MIEYMLANIICGEFDKVVGKGQHESRKAMHVGFRMNVGDSTDQYRKCHLYIYGPCNYVHVAVQEESIDEKGERHVGKMEHLCYHDSCWRDSVQSFIFKRRGELNGFSSLKCLTDWYDVLELTEAEREYLYQMDKARHVGKFGTDHEKDEIAEKMRVNPFDKRTIWKG